MITPPSINDLYQAILKRFRDEAGITAQSNSSVASALAASYADVTAALWAQIADVDRSLSIDKAIGLELDAIGKFLGVDRNQATRASTLGYGPALLLQNNGSTTITVPVGTAIFSAKQPTTLFRTFQDYTIGGYGVVGADIEAQGTGPQYNVGALALNSHNSGIAQLTVSNPRPVDSGSDTETDDSYRGRLYQATNLRNPGSRVAIRFALAALPGIRDVRILENSGGAGTFDVMLIGQGSVVPANSFALAQSYLAEYAPVGVAYRVILPTLIPIDITIKLILPASQESSRQSLTSAAASAARNYIDSLDIEDGTGAGEFTFSIFIERIGAAVINAKDFSIDVSINNVPIVFGNNYTPQINERLSARRVRVE